MSLQGKVKEVQIVTAGANLDLPASIGDVVLTVDSVDDFDEQGGQLIIDDSAPLTYLSIDEVEQFTVDAEGETDPPVCTITLSVPLTVNYPENAKVSLYPLSSDKVAQVLLAANDDEPVEVLVGAPFIGYLEDGVRQEGFEETVIVDQNDTGDLEVVSLVGQSSYISVNTGEIGQSSPPVSTDGLPPGQVLGVTTRGAIKMVLVEWPALENADLVTYKVYGSTQSGFTADANSFLGDTQTLQFFAKQVWDPVAGAMTTLSNPNTYYFTVIANDFDGPGPASAQASGVPALITSPDIAVNAIIAEHILAGEITADKLAATIILASQLYLGANISLLPTDLPGQPGTNGITVKSPNVGGKVRFPTDGSAARFEKVGIEADDLLVNNNFDLRGLLNRIGGSLDLAQGVDTPVNGPTVSITTTYPGSVSSAWDRSAALGINQGLVDAGTNWASVETGASGNGRVVGYNKTTGVMTVLVSAIAGGSWYPLDIAKYSTDYYVLYMDFSDTAANRYKIRKYNSSWVYQSGWTFSIPASCSGPPGISIDSTTGLLYASWYRNLSDYKTVVYSYALTGGAGTLVLTCNDSSSSSGHNRANFMVNTSFYGSQKFFIQVNGLGTYIYPPGNPSSPDTTRANPWNGYGWYTDGTDAWVLSVSGTNFVVTKVNKDVKVGQTVRARWSRFDSDPLGTGGQHETAWSTNYTQYNQPALSYFTVSTPAPGDNGDPNDPDSIRHYIQLGAVGNYWRQPDVTVSPWIAYYALPVSTGSSAVSTPDFTGVGNPGIIQSQIVDSLDSRRMIDLRGDGSGKIGAYRWGVNGAPVNDTSIVVLGTNTSTLSTSSGTFIRHPLAACETTFTAPPSGNVDIIGNTYMQNFASLVLMCPEVRLGSTIGSGTIVYTAGVADAVGAQLTTTQLMRFQTRITVRGLTPGTVYNTYLAFYRTAAGTDINNTCIRVIPMR